MEGPILSSVKELLGISYEDESFDFEILMHINATLAILFQMGVDEAGDTPVIDITTTWRELFGDRTDLEMVKTYIYFKVKSMFDPPTNSAGLESLNRVMKEFEWRINNLQTINHTLKEVIKDE
mgnify:FL=1